MNAPATERRSLSVAVAANAIVISDAGRFRVEIPIGDAYDVDLKIGADVKSAPARSAEDQFVDFVVECCEVDIDSIGTANGLWETVAEVSAAYEWWCKRGGRRAMRREEFVDRLESLDLTQGRSRRPSGRQARNLGGHGSPADRSARAAQHFSPGGARAKKPAKPLPQSFLRFVELIALIATVGTFGAGGYFIFAALRILWRAL